MEQYKLSHFNLTFQNCAEGTLIVDLSPSYGIDASYDISDSNSDIFSFNSSGMITVAQSLDYERQTSYKVNCEAKAICITSKFSV